MLAFPFMLISAAQNAGMTVPEDADNFLPDDFPHFYVFCNVQLGRPMSSGAHWENAKVIAAIPESQLRTVTMSDIENLGWIF